MKLTEAELKEMIKEQVAQKVIKRKGAFDDSDPYDSPDAVLSIHKTASKDDKIVEFQKRCDDLYLTATIMKRDPRSLKLYKSFKTFVDKSDLKKAMDSVTGGSGQDWVPTDFSADLIELVELERKVAAQFRRINMPTDPFKMPGKKSFTSAKLAGSENTAVGTSSVGTRNIVLNASKLMVNTEFSMELVEDSIIAILPMLREDTAESLARGEEDALVNGDTASPHMDSDITASDDARKTFLGLRAHAIDQSYTSPLSTFDFDKIVDLKIAMDKYGVNADKLFWLTGSKGHGRLLTLRDEKDNNILITMDKIGPQATVVTGMVGMLLGSPVIISELVRGDLNATGTFDATTATNTTLSLVRKDGFIIGDRRSITIKTDEDIQKDTNILVASQRLDFQPRFDIETEKIVRLGVGVA